MITMSDLWWFYGDPRSSQSQSAQLEFDLIVWTSVLQNVRIAPTKILDVHVNSSEVKDTFVSCEPSYTDGTKPEKDVCQMMTPFLHLCFEPFVFFGTIPFPFLAR